MTIREILSSASTQFPDPKSEDTGQDCRILLAWVLGTTREFLAAHPENTVAVDDEQKYYSIIRRRVKGEPVSYITNNKEFFGLQFYVNPHVLIPRPETEHLVEEVLQVSGNLDLKDTQFIDVGTGSGAIALAVAKSLPDSKIIAVDTSVEALTVACRNSERLCIDQVFFLESDLLSTVKHPAEKNIVLMANLPYVAEAELNLLDPTVRDFEPLSALAAGEDGLDLYRRLISQITRLFQGRNVWLVFECDPAQIAKMKKLIRYSFLDPTIRIYKDLSGKMRGGVVHMKL